MGSRINHKKYQETFLKNYTHSAFLIEKAELQFTLDPITTCVKTKLYIKRNKALKSSTTSIKLDGINLKLEEIKLNNKILPTSNYLISSSDLIILQVPNNFILETTVTLNPQKNLTCTGLYLTNKNFCTQNEPCGFRHITYFIDRPDVLTKFTTIIIADRNQYPVLLANGNVISKTNLKNNLHQIVWADPFPKSAYLFALVAGNFFYLEDYYLTKTGRRIKLRIYVESKSLIKQCHHAMISLKQAMLWDEKEFNLEYDLDLYQIVAINDLNVSAMENKGLNVFNTSALLASPLTATDTDFKRVTAVIAHEYFHNWTGNRVTCRDWFQIGLKEGLTTLREQLFMEDTYGQSLNRINTIKIICTDQFSEDSSPLSHPIRLRSYIDVNNFYTTTIYYKSAEVARMIITIFGNKMFRRIIKKFLTKFDGKAATIEDFITVASKVTKIDLKQFKLWYDQFGTPLLKIKGNFKDKIYSVTFIQEHHKAPKNFYIPLKIGFLDSSGKNLQAQTLIIKNSRQKFTFKGFDIKPVPSFLKNFSAPVKIFFSYTDNELLHLMRYDNDPIIRWEASQKLMIKTILTLCQYTAIKRLPVILIQMFDIIINNRKIDPSLTALMMKLPSEIQLLDISPKTTIESVHTIREFIKRELASIFKTKLLNCYNDNCSKKSYRFNACNIEKRELKNTCLSYLMYLNTIDVFTICEQQIKYSNNLTDIYAGLNFLVNSRHRKREQFIDLYYKKWCNHPNLINKWFILNSTIKCSGNLSRVKKLLKHPAFSLSNPNNVYSLIHTFCEINLINFHAKDGSSYKFLSDQIIAIDEFNPQLAAALTISLTYGCKFDTKRNKLMQEQLNKIKCIPNISPNVYEIVNKSIS
ncbi:MAG: aminopeptidase N [Coxiellaceae bacterium]|jgi:aminopeptidase N|nr:aminopeptidase N [Coxiellaceae bacterium]